MENSRLLTIIWCNKDQLVSVTETSLKGYFVSYAKRYQKNSFFLRRNAYYSFWWHVVNSAFLQIDYNRKTKSFLSQSWLFDEENSILLLLHYLYRCVDALKFLFLQISYASISSEII